VLSDVHGNMAALEAVLAEIDHEAPDLVVNLGDLVSGALEPGATATRLRAADHVVVRGNHERQVLEGSDLPSDLRATAELTDEDLSWLASLPERVEPAPGVVAVHGSPRDDLEYLLETVDRRGARPASAAEVVERLGDDSHASLVLCGHSHLARVRRIEGGPLVVNPGSVGWPAYRETQPFPHVMEAGSPHARYALVEKRDGAWTATPRQVVYDWEAAARLAELHGRPDAAFSLRTGRAPAIFDAIKTTLTPPTT